MSSPASEPSPRDDLLLAMLAAATAPLGLAYAVYRLGLRVVFELRAGARPEQRLFLVYSRSPHWDSYIREHWLPRLEGRVTLLNWSDRAHWRDSHSLAAFAFRHWAPDKGFNPMLLAIPRAGWASGLSFYDAFRDHKHGRSESLEAAEAEMWARIAAFEGRIGSAS